MYRATMLFAVFACELLALAAFAWFGFSLDASVWVRAIAGFGLPVGVAVVWGLFAAPRARFALPGKAVVAIKSAVYVLAALAVVAVGHPVLAAVCLLVVVVVTGLVRLGHLDEGLTAPAGKGAGDRAVTRSGVPESSPGNDAPETTPRISAHPDV